MPVNINYLKLYSFESLRENGLSLCWVFGVLRVKCCLLRSFTPSDPVRITFSIKIELQKSDQSHFRNVLKSIPVKELVVTLWLTSAVQRKYVACQKTPCDHFEEPFFPTHLFFHVFVFFFCFCAEKNNKTNLRQLGKIWRYYLE